MNIPVIPSDGGRFFPEEDLQARLMEEQREAAVAAAAASAAQHQSDLLTVATASGSSASSSRKRKRTAVGEDNKDDRYWERRRKNNMAAKRSRDARRAKENQIAMRATFLERENRVLTQELGKARAENHLLRERLCKYEVLWTVRSISNSSFISTLPPLRQCYHRTKPRFDFEQNSRKINTILWLKSDF